MLAKKFAIGFGIAVILPCMVYYGVSTFSPKVKWQDYRVEDYHERYKDATKEGKEQLREERKNLEEKKRKHRKRFETHLFYVAVPTGIVAIILGSIIAVQSIGAGLIFGGIFTITNGYIHYWSELQDWMRFLSLFVAFVLLIFVGYTKLRVKVDNKGKS